MRRTIAFALPPLVLLLPALFLATAGPGSPPEVQAMTERQVTQMQIGSHCWQSRFGRSGYCESHDLSTARNPVRLGQSERLTFNASSETPTSASARLHEVHMADAVSAQDGLLAWPPERADLASAPSVALPVGALGLEANRPPGLYLVELTLEFSRGSATYALLVELTH